MAIARVHRRLGCDRPRVNSTRPTQRLRRVCQYLPVEQPTEYEKRAWQDLVDGNARATRKASRFIEEKSADAARAAAAKAAEVARRSPRLVKAGGSVKSAVERVKNAVPEDVRKQSAAWAGEVLESAGKTVTRVSRIGLSPDSVVAKHVKRGHAVETLADIRSLDLEQIDRVKGRNLDLLYAGLGAASGATAGLAITGGEVGVGTGVGSGPGGAVVVGAMATDVAAVIGLASRAVGVVALSYGFDPERPEEKVFVNSVINLGTASSTAAKQAAFTDIARLTQLLIRGSTWKQLSESILVRVARDIAARLSIRFTQRSLGKLLPVAGVVVGATMNWSTLEAVVDSADIAYRRRFLLAKYPHLADNRDIPVVERFGDPGALDDDPIAIDEGFWQEAESPAS
ncbi:serine/arginine repetitive matrix protein 2 [Sphaerisporangium cinnabarinum]|nr:serine/arginine repetitive matrix protein 2 [Sphaerisporangium cinnabarinum]